MDGDTSSTECSLVLPKGTPATCLNRGGRVGRWGKEWTTEHQNTSVPKMMNEAVGLIRMEFHSQLTTRWGSMRESQHILHTRGEMGNGYLSIGNNGIAGRRRINMHFTPVSLGTLNWHPPPPHKSILLSVIWKECLEKNAWNPSWTFTWQAWESKLRIPPWEELEGGRREGAHVQRWKRRNTTGKK